MRGLNPIYILVCYSQSSYNPETALPEQLEGHADLQVNKVDSVSPPP